MAASTAIHSYGSSLSWATTSGGSYTEYVEIVDISADESVGATKVSHLKSQNNFHEYIPSSLAEPGEVTLMLNFTKAQLTTILGHRRTLLYWKITLSDGSVYAFAGFWTKHGDKIPDDDRITCDFTIKRTGAITYTAAA